jgi:hypothetical protein
MRVARKIGLERVNLTSDNWEILIFEHIKIVPRAEVLLFNRKKSFIKERGRFQRHVQNELHSVCASIIVVPPDPLPSYKIKFFSNKDSTQCRRGMCLLTGKWQMEKVSKVEHSCDYLCSPNVGQQQAITCKSLGHYNKKKNSRYRPELAKRVDKDIAVPFRDLGARKWWVVNITPRPF